MTESNPIAESSQRCRRGFGLASSFVLVLFGFLTILLDKGKSIILHGVSLAIHLLWTVWLVSAYESVLVDVLYISTGLLTAFFSFTLFDEDDDAWETLMGVYLGWWTLCLAGYLFYTILCKSSTANQVAVYRSVAINEPSTSASLSPKDMPAAYAWSDADQDTREKVCSICIEDFSPDESVRSLPCRHTFHQRCIDS